MYTSSYPSANGVEAAQKASPPALARLHPPHAAMLARHLDYLRPAAERSSALHSPRMTTLRTAVTNTTLLPQLTVREHKIEVAKQKPATLLKPFPHKPSDAAGRRRRQQEGRHDAPSGAGDRIKPEHPLQPPTFQRLGR